MNLVAAGRERAHAESLGPVTESEVVMLSLLGNKKATSGGTWLKAEGTGLEPATRKRAPDFESGC